MNKPPTSKTKGGLAELYINSGEQGRAGEAGGAGGAGGAGEVNSFYFFLLPINH